MNKNIICLLLFLAPSLITLSFSPRISSVNYQSFPVEWTAIEYNDFIIDQQNKIITKMLDWLKFEEKQIVPGLEDIIKITHSSITEIEKKKPFPGAEEFKRTALDLFRYYERLLSGAFMDFAKVWDENNGNLSEDLAHEMSIWIEEATVDEAKYDAAFAEAQQNFAAANNFEIYRNELQDEIDALDEE